MSTRETSADCSSKPSYIWSVAEDAVRDPASWLGMSDIYGDLGRADRFASSFFHWRRMIGQKGVAASLNAYSNGTVG